MLISSPAKIPAPLPDYNNNHVFFNDFFEGEKHKSDLEKISLNFLSLKINGL